LSGHGFEFGRRDIGPRQQIVDPAVRVAVDDLGEDVGEIAERLDAVELAGLDQRGDDGPVLGATVGAGEQCIFPVERDRSAILPMSGRKLKFVTAGTRSSSISSPMSTKRRARSS
jgi:hypothetical protein